MMEEQMMETMAPASAAAKPAKKPQRKSYGQMLLEQEEEYRQWRAKKAAERQKQLAALKPKHDKELADWIRGLAGEYIWPEKMEQILAAERVILRGGNGREEEKTLLECVREACGRSMQEE